MSSSALNGTSVSADNWVHAVAKLTRHANLHALTMRPWHQVVTTRMLMRRTQAWCHRCFADSRQLHRDLYIPLLWTLQPVTICVHHASFLSTQCPHPGCHAKLPALMPYGHLGYCSSCKRWLGASGGTDDTARPVPQDEIPWHTWVANALGTLVAASSTITEAVTLIHATATLSTILQQHADGSLQKLARYLSLSDVGLRDIIRGQRIPQLDTLLRICYGLGTTPLELLTGSDLARQFNMSACPPPAVPPVLPRSYRVLAVEAVQRQLEAIVAADEQPPPSMADVARRLRHDHSNLSERFPRLCRCISTRYRAYYKAKREAWIQQICEEIRQVMRSVHAAGMYPSHARIQARLIEPTCLRLAEARATRRAVLHELGFLKQ